MGVCVADKTDGHVPLHRPRTGYYVSSANKARGNGALGGQWHQQGDMQTIYASIQTDNHAITSTLNYYVQRVSKH